MSMRQSVGTKNNERGFTIIELLIAMTVLSVILVLTTAMIISIGRLYSKGINQSRIQNNVRSITDEVSQRLQFNSQDPISIPAPPSGFGAYCIGDVRYTYVLNRQIGTIPHVLWRDTVSSGSCANDANLLQPNPSDSSSGTNGSELIAPRSQLRAFNISTTSPFQVTVAVAYGDITLLTGIGPNTRCIGGAGGQFCATASLSTTVGKRID